MLRVKHWAFFAVILGLVQSACAPKHVSTQPPPPPAPIELNLGVNGVTDSSTITVQLTPDGKPTLDGQLTSVNRFVIPVPFEDGGIGASLTVAAPGYVSVTSRLQLAIAGCGSDSQALPLSGPYEVCGVTLQPTKPVPVAQQPYSLPTCGSCPSPYAYDHVLPWTPPQSRDYLRADAWGVVVPGLPFVYGGSSEHPERLLTGFLYKYDQTLWPAIFKAYGERGYTHWILWIDALEAEDAISLDAFVAMCHTIQKAGFYVQVGLNSKVYEPQDQTFAQWQARLLPLMSRLNTEHAADEYAVWEWDSYNVPGQTTINTFKWIGQQAHAAGASFWIHFLPEHTSWFADGDARGRYGFYDDLGTDVDGIQYQGDPNWNIGELQSRIVDTLQQFANQGNRHKLRAFELDAETEFTHDHPTESEAAAFGFLATCTRGPAFVWGSGNGIWLQDGSPLP